MSGGARSICVYCGSSGAVDPVYFEAAETLGRALALRGIAIVYGGGRVGLMGRMADAALAAGGRVIGVIPDFLERYEIGHGGVSELLIVPTMHERKQRLAELADAFMVLPGGFGTLDEFFEILTWKQLALHSKPIILVDVAGYWAPLRTLLNAILDQGFARPVQRGLWIEADGIDAALEALRLAPGETRPPEIERA